jgi:hypothetical protein
MSRFLPADHRKGDERTIGGYAAVHARPAALEGRDGWSYSVEILTDSTGEPERPFGAYFLFVQWKRLGEQGVAGHLESGFLAWGADRTAAKDALGAMLVEEVQRELDALIRARDTERPWWDTVRDDDDPAEGER